MNQILPAKRWIVARPEPSLAASLARSLNLRPSLAQVLLNRGYHDAESALAFLNPRLQNLHDPFELPHMSAAVDRVLEAIGEQQRIVIYGDYDVDGVTSSALLLRVLLEAGAVVHNFLPHRMEEGYGLSRDGIARCLKEAKPALLIAVDCGTSSRDEIADLGRQGIDAIVLDHHEAPAKLPECVAVVNPKIGEGTDLASVGISFKFAHALLKRDARLAERIDLRRHLDLVAIGTVADIVPLTGENRILVKAGLERLPQTRKVGLRALLEVADVSERVNPYHIGFRIGPRLNAAGRLADAMAALELLLTEDPNRAAKLAEMLDERNTERQHIEEKIVEAALLQARQFAGDRVLVLADESWHVGVIGIVASRITQEFYRPSIVIGQRGRGSCRSIAGFSIVEALAQCSSYLEKFGGHEMAAGLSVRRDKIPELRRALNKLAGQTLHGDALTPAVTVEAMIKLEEIDDQFISQLSRFEPCGPGNPTPVFAVEGVQLRGPPRLVGKNHLRFNVTDGETTANAIWWGHGEVKLPQKRFDIAFSAELHAYQGVESVQLKVRDVKEEG
ncbi:MAG TPA: single-stranded-DNA-specific exonuclease RecJ [Verrucomicrobiae bacterium]|nr:single-stranded-DNA-specific exonuclease RecJ [Verrucomicrobiae bacterium]